MSIRYQTKQKEFLISLIQNYGEAPFQASDIVKQVKHEEMSPSRATIYRLLDELESEGVLRKYFLENQTASMYQYVEHKTCHEHLHAICERCGVLYHIDCREFNEMVDHIQKHHKFYVDIEKSSFLGQCERCIEGVR